MRKRSFIKSKYLKMKIAKRSVVFISLFAILIVSSGILGTVLYYQGRFKSGADINYGSTVYFEDYENETLGGSPCGYGSSGRCTGKYYADRSANQAVYDSDAYNSSKSLRLESIIGKDVEVSVNSNYTSTMPDWKFGQLYEASIMAKATSNELPFRLYFNHLVANEANYQFFPATTSWQRYSFKFRYFDPQDGRASGKILPRVGVRELKFNSRNGFVWFDDFTLREIDETPTTINTNENIIPNSNFSLGANYEIQTDSVLEMEKNGLRKDMVASRGIFMNDTRTDPLVNETAPINDPCVMLPKGSGPNGITLARLSLTDYPATYTFSGYFKASTTSLNLRIQLSDGKNLVTQTFGIANTWKRVSLQATFSKPNVAMSLYSYTGGDLLIDNIQLEKGNLSNYAPAPLPEISITTNKYSNVFYTNQPMPFDVNIGNFMPSSSFNGSYELNFYDFNKNNILTKTENVSLNQQEVKKISLDMPIPNDQKGYFYGTVLLKDQTDKTIAENDIAITRIEPYDPANFIDPDPFTGIHLQNFFLFNAASLTESKRWPLIKDTGIKQVRTFDGFIVNDVTKPVPALGQISTVNQNTFDNGMNVFPTFASDQFSQYSSITPPTDLAYFKAWAKRLVENYSSMITYFETENEPPIGSSSLTMSDFIKLQKAVIEGAKEAKPDIKIVSQNVFTSLSKFSPIPEEAFEGVDAASYHYYDKNINSLPEESIPAFIKKIHDNMPTKYKNVPLWNTEGSYGLVRVGFTSSFGENMPVDYGLITAKLNTRKWLIEKGSGVAKSYYHTNGNMIYWNLAMPTYSATAAFNKILDNTKPYRSYADVNDQLHMFIFQNKQDPNKSVISFWQKYDEPGKTYNLPKINGNYTSLDMMGNTFNPGDNNSSLSYVPSTYPQYVTFDGDIKALTTEIEKTLNRDQDTNQKPKINSISASPTTANINQSVNFSSSITNPDDDSLTYAWDFGDSQTSTSITPSHSYAQAGTYTVFLTVSDGTDTHQATTTITVSSGSPNNPPILDPVDDKSVEVDSNLKFTISATDFDKKDKLTYSATNLPTGATFNPNSQKFDWTPTSSDVGTHLNIIFSVTDGTDTDSETISITVSSSTITPPTNNPPVLDPIGDKSVEVDINLKFTISAIDQDKKDKLTYSATNLPSGATFNPNSQKFDWTPTSSDVGTHSGIVFSVSDGTDTSSETITITVNNPVGGGDETIYPPTNLQAFDNGNNVHLKWDDDQNTKSIIDHYNIYRRVNQQTVTNINTSKSTNYIDKTAPDSSYIQYAVQAVSKLGTTSTLSASADITMPDLTPPIAPTNLRVSIENNNTNKPKVTLSWDTSTDNTTSQDKIRYWLYRSVDGTDLKEINNAFKTSIEDTSVKNKSAIYSYYVLAQDKNKLFSAPSNTVNIQVQLDESNPIGGSKDITQITTKPQPPQNLRLNLRYSKDSQAYHTDISWEHSSSTNLKNYKIYRDDIEVDSVTANRTSLLDTSPPPGTITYTIKSMDDQNIISDPSNAVTIDIPEALKLTQLNMNQITTNKAEISLTTNIPSEVHIKYGQLSWLRAYEYIRGKLQKSYTPQINLNKNQSDDVIILDHTITLPTLARNSLYYYQIEVTNPANTDEVITLPQEQFRTPMFGWWR